MSTSASVMRWGTADESENNGRMMMMTAEAVAFQEVGQGQRVRCSFWGKKNSLSGQPLQ